ncbi:MAG: glycosyltransferase family 4 protein [Anaerolineae bacterium]|nr:glycosyltransferase family 4 protein [Anaerolineae bacterium]
MSFGNLSGLPLCIGIDASRAVSQSPTGTEGYSYHLTRALLPELSSRYRVCLYTNQPLHDAEWQSFPCVPAPHIPTRGVGMRLIPFPRLWTHLRLSWEMMRYPPDLLFVPAHVLPLARPRRTLVTVHDVGYRYFPEAHPWRQRLYLDLSTRWNVQVATHILADSQATKDAMVQVYGTPAAKITVAYPGYDSDLVPVREPEVLAAARARYGIPANRDYVCYIGRIQPRKNLARLVTAFARLLSDFPDLTLVLAGPTGWLADPIHTQVQHLNLENRVLFPGYIAEADKAALISGARVFVYPSLYEGFGFPVLEAQACQVPLLASSSSSLPEVVGTGGLLVDPLDEDAIAAGLRRLLSDENLRQTLIAHGIENLRRFAWDKTARIVTGLINKLVKEYS